MIIMQIREMNTMQMRIVDLIVNISLKEDFLVHFQSNFKWKIQTFVRISPQPHEKGCAVSSSPCCASKWLGLIPQKTAKWLTWQIFLGCPQIQSKLGWEEQTQNRFQGVEKLPRKKESRIQILSEKQIKISCKKFIWKITFTDPFSRARIQVHHVDR